MRRLLNLTSLYRGNINTWPLYKWDFTMIPQVIFKFKCWCLFYFVMNPVLSLFVSAFSGSAFGVSQRGNFALEVPGLWAPKDWQLPNYQIREDHDAQKCQCTDNFRWQEWFIFENKGRQRHSSTWFSVYATLRWQKFIHYHVVPSMHISASLTSCSFKTGNKSRASHFWPCRFLEGLFLLCLNLASGLIL